MVKTNCVLNVVFSSEGAEVLTLPEVKAHLNISFTDFDSYLTELIKRVRAQTERRCGISIIERTVTALIQNDIGGQRLPYGPVNTVTDTSLTVTGGRLMDVIGEQEVEYTAGYGDNVPEDLKQAMLEEIAFQFDNRGDENKGSLSAQYLDKVNRYNFNKWVL